MTFSTFKIYTEAVINLKLFEKHNLVEKFNTTSKPLYNSNFNKDCFLKENLTKSGETKFSKGLWEFTLQFVYEINPPKNLISTLTNWSVSTIAVDFNLKTFVDGNEVNDRPSFKLNGLNTQFATYTFQVPIENEGGLLKIEIEPKAQQFMAGAPTKLVDLKSDYICNLEGLCLFGKKIIDYPDKL